MAALLAARERHPPVNICDAQPNDQLNQPGALRQRLVRRARQPHLILTLTG